MNPPIDPKAVTNPAESALQQAADKQKGKIGDAASEFTKTALNDPDAALDAIKGLDGEALEKGLENIKLTAEDLGGKFEQIAKGAVYDKAMGVLASLGFGPSRKDHQGGFNFRVELGGIQAGAFRAVDGLSTTVELIEYQGGGDMFGRQIPGRPKIAPVVLKKGYVNTAVLWDWMQATMKGQFKFENVSVVLLDDSGTEELARYNLMHTWPSRWSGWQLDANGSNAMVEEMELQVREMERVA